MVESCRGALGSVNSSRDISRAVGVVPGTLWFYRNLPIVPVVIVVSFRPSQLGELPSKKTNDHEEDRRH